MQTLRVFLARLAASFSSRRDRRLDEEIAAHLDALEAEHLARGLTPHAARLAARRDFGAIPQIQQEYNTTGAFTWLDDLRQDVRYGLRTMKRAPAFAGTAVLTLAVGIGAATAVFTVLDATLWQPLPVRSPDTLLALSWSTDHAPKRQSSMEVEDCAADSGKASGCTVPYSLAARFESSGVFSSLTSFAGPVDLSLSGPMAASTVRTYFVSGSFFDTLGISTSMGRPIHSADDADGVEPVVVLGHAFWQTKFNGNSDVVGTVLRLNGAPFTVIGVAEPRFTRLSPGFVHDLWIPLTSVSHLGLQWLPKSIKDDGFWGLEVLGRLAPGTSAPQAKARAAVAMRDWNASLTTPPLPADARPAVHLRPAQEALTGLRPELTRPTGLLMAAVVVLLLMACANVAGLLLARTVGRRPEMALRAALGAGRARLARQLIVESSLLAFAGGLAGMLIGSWGSRIVLAFLEEGRIGRTSLGVYTPLRVAAFVIVLTIVAALVIGLVQAFATLRRSLMLAIKDMHGGLFAGRRKRRLISLGGGLVVGQVAASALLLLLGSLVFRSLTNLQRVDPGFDTGRLLTFGINLGAAGYSPQRAQGLYRDLTGRLKALPGVTSVSYASEVLLAGSVSRTEVDLPGAPGQSVSVNALSVGPDFFETTGIPLLAGRRFEAGDFVPGGRPMIVNQAFVRELLGRSAETASLRVEDYPMLAQRTIVGIVKDTRLFSLRGEPRPAMYTPLKFNPFTTVFTVRTPGAPAALADGVRRVVAEVDRNVPILQLQTQEDVIARSLFVERLLVRLGAAFSSISLVLVAIGLYGLLAYSVEERRRELGIRLALGELPWRIRRRVMQESLTLSTVGLLLGIPLALMATHWISSIVFGVSRTDAVSLFVVLVIVQAVAVVAAWRPATAAAAVDPMTGIRQT